MRKWVLGMAAVLALAGCARTMPPESGIGTGVQAPPLAEAPPSAGPQPGASPGGAPGSSGAAPLAPAAPKALTPVAGSAVDWLESLTGPGVAPPLTDNACLTTAADLEVSVRNKGWRAHPLRKNFFVPATEVVVCNATPAPTRNRRLSLTALSKTRSIALPDLQPGQAAGPLRIYSVHGVPEGVLRFWTEGGKLPPDPGISVSLEPRPAVDLPALHAGLPGKPTLADLRHFAWTSGSALGRDGKQVELFLYSPTAAYSITTSSYCGAISGSVSAKADDWAIFASHEEGAPVLVGLLGAFDFTGDRGMLVQPVPALGATFLMMGMYGSCANPNRHEMWAYDPEREKLVSVQTIHENGTSAPTTVTDYSFTPDGKLVNKFYNNADGIGWHTYVYTWDKAAFTWVFQEHRTGDKK